MQSQWSTFLNEQGFSLLPEGGIAFNNLSSPNNPRTKADEHSSYFSELSNYDSLVLSGPDNAKFLQGQVSCNLDHLSASHSLRGAYCTPKGNVIANFDMCLHNDLVVLHMAKGMAEQVKTAMAKYIVFSKAELHDQSQTWVRFGIWGSNNPHVMQQLVQKVVQTLTKDASPQPNAGSLSQQGDCISLDSGFIYCVDSSKPRFVVYCAPEQAQALWQTLQTHSCAAETVAWEGQQIQDGLVHIGQAITDSYVPQMLNLQETNTIDFKKGCYTGQEIVARMQYLGKLKRHLMIGKITTDQVIEVGMSIDASNRNNIGRIISLAKIDTQSYWFSGVINTKEADDKHLKVSSIEDSQVTLQALPYSIDPQVFERITL